MAMIANNEEGFVLPKDFEEKMKSLLGDEWDAFLSCYTSDKYQALRFNPLKVDTKSQDELQRILAKLGIEKDEPVMWENNGRYYNESDCVRPGKHPYHEMGLYYIQEPSAMSAAGLLEVQPGDKVLDLCAAPGGKSTQLAGFLMGEGLLVANEIHPERSKILAQNMERLGVGNVIVTNEDPIDLPRHFSLFFDKILVDAPCSGEGMFRKNPDAVQEWSKEQVQVCQERQLYILDEAAKMLAPGGTLVYSTCTFSPEEDEACIGLFLEEHPDFTVKKVDAPYFSPAHPEWGNGNEDLKNTFRLWPHKLHGEGHYIAVLQKQSVVTSETIAKKAQSGDKLKKEYREQLEEFCKTTLTSEISNKILNGNLILFGENLYLLPEGISGLKGLKIRRAGLQIGEFKKNRFEPSHALALYLKNEMTKVSYNLSVEDSRTAGYFRGEGIYLNPGEEESVQKGWCLICVDGYSAGWGKQNNAQIKNHYPKGLRRG